MYAVTPFSLPQISFNNPPNPFMFTAVLCTWLFSVLHFDSDITNKIITIVGVLLIRYIEKKLMKHKWFKDIKKTIAPLEDGETHEEEEKK